MALKYNLNIILRTPFCFRERLHVFSIIREIASNNWINRQFYWTDSYLQFHWNKLDVFCPSVIWTQKYKTSFPSSSPLHHVDSHFHRWSFFVPREVFSGINVEIYSFSKLFFYSIETTKRREHRPKNENMGLSDSKYF